MTFLVSVLLASSVAMFLLGLFGFFNHRSSFLLMLFSVEVLFLSASSAFLLSAYIWGSFENQAFVFFVLAMAAAEAAVGLSLFVAYFKLTGTVELEFADAVDQGVRS